MKFIDRKYKLITTPPTKEFAIQFWKDVLSDPSIPPALWKAANIFVSQIQANFSESDAKDFMENYNQIVKKFFLKKDDLLN